MCVTPVATFTTLTGFLNLLIWENVNNSSILLAKLQILFSLLKTYAQVKDDNKIYDIKISQTINLS